MNNVFVYCEIEGTQGRYSGTGSISGAADQGSQARQ